MAASNWKGLTLGAAANAVMWHSRFFKGVSPGGYICHSAKRIALLMFRNQSICPFLTHTRSNLGLKPIRYSPWNRTDGLPLTKPNSMACCTHCFLDPNHPDLCSLCHTSRSYALLLYSIIYLPRQICTLRAFQRL